VRKLVLVPLALVPLLLAPVASAAPGSGSATPPPNGQWAVTLDRAPLLGSPNDDGDRFAVLGSGAPLEILGYQGDFASVWNPRTRGTAYVRSDLLGPSDPPSPFLLKDPPPPTEQLDDSGVVTDQTSLSVYPTPDEGAVDRPLGSSSWVHLTGVVRGDDGKAWYSTADGDYVPTGVVFLPSAPERYPGHWLDVDLTAPARVTAYEGDQPVRSFLTIKGAGPRPTPMGTFTIIRRVANETMNSDTIGIPRNGPGGYYLTGVLFTQYFTADGASLHYNYWSSNWGYPGSHGCLGLTYNDSAWLWDWATLGTPVSIHY
jgi:L,D-transpeptidase catalytic domain